MSGTSPTETSEQIDAADREAASLVERMTLAERIGQMCQLSLAKQGAAEVETRIRKGQCGSILNYYDSPHIGRLQAIARAESRLGIPLLVGNDVIHGYRTIFPIPLAESCSWDPQLAERAAEVAAREAAEAGTNWIFAPMIDVARDARWGRVAEGAGEDPMLVSRFAIARTRGFQRMRLADGRRVVACAKHFVAYGAAQAGKDYAAVDVSTRTLWDVYMPPFAAAVDAGVASVMTAFHELSGLPITAHGQLIDGVLRAELGFAGFVVSDWNAIEELIAHGVAADRMQAAELALLAGIDMDMTSDCYHDHLADLCQRGRVPPTRIDTAARRIVAAKVRLGLFDPPVIEVGESSCLAPAHRELALVAATRSMVLLKNSGPVLPVAPGRRVALIGPLADDHHEALGCWHRIGRDEDTDSVLEGMRAACLDVSVEFVMGSSLHDGVVDGEEASAGSTATEASVATQREAAVLAARRADVAVMVLGEPESWSGEAHSRAHLGLPSCQQALLEAVHATGTPVVLVLMCGRPLVVPWAASHVGAILVAWHGGIAAGRAVADLVCGRANPSGKLSISWPRAEGQLPIYYARKNSGRPPEAGGTMQFDADHKTAFIDEHDDPQYGFGHGLSYTEFAYSDLRIDTPVVRGDGVVVASVQVNNVGGRAGIDVVQLYVRDLVGEVTRPVRQLAAFASIELEPGQGRRVRLEVPVDALRFHGRAETRRIEAGEYHLWIGPDSQQGLRGAFTLVLDDSKPVPRP